MGPQFLDNNPEHVSYEAHQPDARKSQFKIRRHPLLMFFLSSSLSFGSDSVSMMLFLELMFPTTRIKAEKSEFRNFYVYNISRNFIF